MSKYLSLAIANLFLLSSVAFASELNRFCAEVPKWPKGQDVRKIPGLKKYTEVKVGTPVDANFAIEKIKSKGWLVIDARDLLTRKTTGRVIGALQFVSDYKHEDKNEFSVTKLLKNFSKKKSIKHLIKRDIKHVKSKDDLKDIKYILFCNGYKCHRSSFAACKLRDMGVAFENIHLVLGGFDELQKNGAKIR